MPQDPMATVNDQSIITPEEIAAAQAAVRGGSGPRPHAP
jgi:hypothetical protein